MEEEQNVCVVGSGGREAEIARTLSQSNDFDRVFVAPGNGGTREYAERMEVTPSYPHPQEFIDHLIEKQVRLVVGGSETDLVQGLGDHVRMNGLKFAGVSQAAARLEGDKAFASQFRKAYQIPQPDFKIFDSGSFQVNRSKAIDFGQSQFKSGVEKLVVKYPGLAGGKGVKITNDLNEFGTALTDLFIYGGDKTGFVVEEFVAGPEVSLTVLVQNSVNYKILSCSQDYKRAGEGDTGLNTGGMGAVTVDLPQSLMRKIDEKIIKPTIWGAEEIGGPIDRGVLYIGLIFDSQGNPSVLEYNMRFGDPETQVIVPRIKSDLGEALCYLASGANVAWDLEMHTDHFATVVLAAKGYPGDYSASQGKLIQGIEAARKTGAIVNIAGTTFDGENYLVKGSRVLNITGQGKTQEEAIAAAYNGVEKITSSGLKYRPDIGCNLPKLDFLRSKYG